jgi:hypothetical protein
MWNKRKKKRETDRRTRFAVLSMQKTPEAGRLETGR